MTRGQVGRNPSSGTDAVTKTYVDNAVTGLVNASSAQTLTNKWIQPRIGSTASSATPAINTDSYDQYNITALATGITSMTTSLTGTPVDGQKLIIQITDNATSQTIAWGSKFVSSGMATLPTKTVASRTHYVELIWSGANSVWTCIKSDLVGYASTSPSVQGSYFRQYRVGTGTSSLTSGSTILLPNSWFDTADVITSDLTYASATSNKLTVTTPGIYQVSVQTLYVATAATTQMHSSAIALYKNGSVFQYGPSTYVYDTAANIYTGATLMIQLAAGDYIQPGIYYKAGQSGIAAITGEATGAASYFQVTRISQ